MKTFYDILKISEDASFEEIENAYKKMKLYYDNYLDDEENKALAREKLKKINLAFDILGNEEKRRAYDKDLVVMRQDELMNNLKKNTDTHNDEIRKQEEEKIEAEKKIQEEKIKKENEEKINFIKGEIAKQIESQNQKFEEEKIEKERIQKQQELEKERLKKLEEVKRKEFQNAKEQIYKAYKKKIKIDKLNNMSPIRKFFRTIIATIIVFGIIFVILQIPAVKEKILNIDIIQSIINN